MLTHPEAIVGLLICEKALPNEAVVVKGARRMAHYKGYASTL